MPVQVPNLKLHEHYATISMRDGTTLVVPISAEARRRPNIQRQQRTRTRSRDNNFDADESTDPYL